MRAFKDLQPALAPETKWQLTLGAKLSRLARTALTSARGLVALNILCIQKKSYLVTKQRQLHNPIAQRGSQLATRAMLYQRS